MPQKINNQQTQSTPIPNQPVSIAPNSECATFSTTTLEHHQRSNTITRNLKKNFLENLTIFSIKILKIYLPIFSLLKFII